MKKLLMGLLLVVGMGCNRDKGNEFQEWDVMEWCQRPSYCTVVACGEVPKQKTMRFKASEVQGVKEGDVVVYNRIDCADFYRKYLKRVK